jgi:hypothetical protein
MGLISKYGKAEADRRKLLNRKSYQEILFAMIDKKFSGEEYCLPPLVPPPACRKGRIGLEQRAADRWGAFNAVVEYVDYVRSTRNDKRSESLLFGSGAQLKQAAWDNALSLAR